MKIFIHAHYYLPRTLAGAEKFLHEIAIYLQDNGHDVIVSIDEDHEYTFEGIKVISNQRNIAARYQWADKVITHLLNEDAAINLGWFHNKPVYHLLHNNMLPEALLQAPPQNFVIYNSVALRDEIKTTHALSLPFIVCRPPIDTDHWNNDTDHFYNEYVTLVNCTYEKGGGFMARQLAPAMPGTRFMGVHGGYGTQIIENPQTRNIQFMPTQADMKTIYDRTRILIMPSVYESWGMVASEAMASGIPVICSDTPGLRENCGDAAIYVTGQDVAGYRNAIESLNVEPTYALAVRRGKKRNKYNNLKTLLQFMETGKAYIEALHTPLEKQIIEPVKEKHEVFPGKEKKVIEKPGTVKRSHKKKLANG